MEGVSHESASLAGHLGLGRLCVVYDDNHITIDGSTELALSDDAPARFRAYGWDVHELGEQANDLDALTDALLAAKRGHRPPDPPRPALAHRVSRPPPGPTTHEAHGTPFPPEELAATKRCLGPARRRAVLRAPPRSATRSSPRSSRCATRARAGASATRADPDRGGARSTGCWPARTARPPDRRPSRSRRDKHVATRQRGVDAAHRGRHALPRAALGCRGPDREHRGAAEGRDRAVQGAPDRVASCTSASASSRWRARSPGWRCTAASSRSAPRSSCSPTTCARRSASRRSRRRRSATCSATTRSARPGRPDPPAGRPAVLAARDPGPRRHPAGRRQRVRRGVRGVPRRSTVPPR